MRTTLTLCLAALLTACGGGGEEEISYPKAPTMACSSREVVTVDLAGDSTHWGYDSFTRAKATPSPVESTQLALDDLLGPGTTIVRESAVKGATAADVLAAGLSNADIVVVNNGINDWSRFTLDAYEANLREIIAKSPARVLLETPNWTPGDNQGLRPYVERMRFVAATSGAPLADTFAYNETIPNWQTVYFAPGDWAHPNAEGYRLIAVNSRAPAVAAMVKAMRCK